MSGFKLLGEKPRPDGITEITVDLDGVRTITISVLTAERHSISLEDLEFIARINANKSEVTPEP